VFQGYRITLPARLSVQQERQNSKKANQTISYIGVHPNILLSTALQGDVSPAGVVEFSTAPVNVIRRRGSQRNPAVCVLSVAPWARRT
jgi:hypothetical protein